MRNSHVTVNVHLYSKVKFLEKMNKKMNKTISVSLISICILPEHMCNYGFIQMEIRQWYQSQ